MRALLYSKKKEKIFQIKLQNPEPAKIYNKKIYMQTSAVY